MVKNGRLVQFILFALTVPNTYDTILKATLELTLIVAQSNVGTPMGHVNMPTTSGPLWKHPLKTGQFQEHPALHKILAFSSLSLIRQQQKAQGSGNWKSIYRFYPLA